MRIRVSKYNAEGYYSPTEYEGMKNLLREEYERKRAQRKPAFMPKVFICSPLRGDVYKNILNAKKYCRFAVESGYGKTDPVRNHGQKKKGPQPANS